MKAKTINETLNFERGKDPIQSMGIGITELSRNFFNKIKEIGWDPYAFRNHTYFIIDNKKIIIGVAYNVGEFSGTYYILFKDPNSILNMPELRFMDTFKIEKIIKSEFSEKIFGKKLDENFNFERGKDPIKSMEIGVTQLTKTFFNRISDEYGFSPRHFPQHCYFLVDAEDKNAGVLYDPGGAYIFFLYRVPEEIIQLKIDGEDDLEDVGLKMKRMPIEDFDRII
jgi:hypothetical protein